jgi:hypothetical protein
MSGQLHTPAALPSGERTPGTYWIGGWVNPRAGLDTVEKRKILPLLGIEPRSPSLNRMSYPDSYQACLPPAFTLISCSAYSWILKMEAICSSETSVDFQRTTRRYSTLHNQRCENLKSYTVFILLLSSKTLCIVFPTCIWSYSIFSMTAFFCLF